jgi:hypothetical protein
MSIFAPLCVTEPPKIITYYRLSLYTWPLSNNKNYFVASAGSCPVNHLQQDR